MRSVHHSAGRDRCIQDNSAIFAPIIGISRSFAWPGIKRGGLNEHRGIMRPPLFGRSCRRAPRKTRRTSNRTWRPITHGWRVMSCTYPTYFPAKNVFITHAIHVVRCKSNVDNACISIPLNTCVLLLRLTLDRNGKFLKFIKRNGKCYDDCFKCWEELYLYLYNLNKKKKKKGNTS